ncbi:MAG: hypothetical protein IPL53_13375 [Ignavibacteria bacterium]|nr:hypothetical protein [Ignavibacteria bacterium]
MDNTQRNPRHDDSARKNESLGNQNTNLKIILSGLGLLILMVVLYFALSGESDYEKGVKYLNEKQYSQALVEFQKVDTNEKDFKLAQSKINYINGLNASTQGLNPQALMFLSKVDPADEYYNESRLMIEKINLANRRVDLENLSEKVNQTNDTLVIIDKTGDGSTDSESQTKAETSLTKNEKPLPKLFQKSVTEFEKQFRLGETASADNKKKYLLILDSLYNEFSGYEITKNSDQSVAEVNKAVSDWMQIRLDFLNTQIAGNAENNTNSLRQVKEEGDKAYFKIQNLLSQYR